jgi:hypothetical protein
VRIHHITLSRKQLDSIPQPERRLLVLMAHAGNELNVLSKLFHFSAKAKSTTPILQEAENAQSMVIGRVLTGKIYECWILMGSAFFGSGLSKKYEPQFDQEALAALKALKQYFGRENLVEKVRNGHAFHYSPEQIDAGYRTLADGDPLEVYLANANANTIYTFADTIAGRAMLEDIKPGDHRRAFEMLVEETSKAVGRINKVIAATMTICFKTYLGSDLYALGAKVIEIQGAPDSQSVSIPYFVEIAEDNDA